MKTKEFSLDKVTYFQITFQKYIRRRIWWMLLFLIFAAIMIFIDMNIITILLIAYAIIYPVLIFIAFTYRFHKSVSPSVFQKRYLSLTETSIVTHLENGNEVPIDLNDIKYLKENKSHVRAYTSDNTFIFIPAYAFESTEDYKKFVNALKKSLSLKQQRSQ